MYGIYEIIAELLGQGKPSNKEEGLPKIATKKCPRCAEYVKSEAKICRYCHHEFSDEEVINPAEAQFCELCGQSIIIADSVASGESRSLPVSDRPSQDFSKIPAVIATVLVCAIFLGAGFYAWQAMRYGSTQTLGLNKQLDVQKSAGTTAGSSPADISPPKQTPAAPSDQELPGPFRLGSKWAIDWQSKYRYRGVMQIQAELAPNKYLSAITVRFTTKRKTRKTVWMGSLVTVKGRDVVIKCRNPNVSWWDTDDFYLVWENNTLKGYNVDKKGPSRQCCLYPAGGGNIIIVG